MSILKSLTSLGKISVNQNQKINTDSKNGHLSFETENNTSRWRVPTYTILYNMKYRLVAYC